MSSLIHEGEKLVKNIAALCDKVEQDWKKIEYDIEIFPALVLKYFEDFDLSMLSELKNISLLTDMKEVSKLQEPSSFSDLYFKLYDNGNFWVEILNWWGLDINIHDHNFTGVQFQLQGESLNVVYSFDEKLELDNLALGDFDIKRVELWRPNDYSIVRSGRSEPHNVIHLDIPTVSLLIRTYPRDELPSQNNYFPPLLRADYSISTPIFRKKIAILRLLSQGNQEDFISEYLRVYKSLSPVEKLFMIIKTVDILFHEKSERLINEISNIDDLSDLNSLAARFYLQSNYFSTLLKRNRFLDRSEIYFLGSLAATFDKNSLKRVIDALGNKIEILPEEKVFDIADKLDEESKILFYQGLKLFEIEG